jgi:hypothetical protein
MPRLQDPAGGFRRHCRLNGSGTTCLSHFDWNPPTSRRSHFRVRSGGVCSRRCPPLLALSPRSRGRYGRLESLRVAFPAACGAHRLRQRDRRLAHHMLEIDSPLQYPAPWAGFFIFDLAVSGPGHGIPAPPISHTDLPRDTHGHCHPVSLPMETQLPNLGQLGQVSAVDCTPSLQFSPCATTAAW